MSARLSLLLTAASLAFLACPGPQKPPPSEPAPDAGIIPVPPDAGPQEPPDAGPPPLLHLEGPLELAPGVSFPRNARVAVLWFAGVDPTAPEAPRASMSGEKLSVPAPARWKLDLTAEPPQAARAPFRSPGGGAGSYAVGSLVVYDDLDGDGAITPDVQGRTIDQLLGSSAGAMPFDLELAGRRTLVLWREGTLGPDEAGFVAGYNLVTLDQPFDKPTRVPATTDVTLRVSGDPRLQLSFCPEAFAAETPEFACGQRVYRAPRVNALLLSMEDLGLAASIQVTAGPRPLTDARVLLNGVVIPADPQGGYNLLELLPSVLHTGLNQLRVEATGFDPVAFPVMLPTTPTFHTPSAGEALPTSTSITVAWTPVERATSYELSLFPDSGGEGVYVSTGEAHVDLVTPAAVGPAMLSVSVVSEGSVGRHVSMGTSSRSLQVSLVAP